MNLNFNIRFLSIPLLFIISFGMSGKTYAQQTDQPVKKTENQKIEDVRDGDVVITANVTARELKYEVVPNPTVEFLVTKQRKNVWEAERINLPQTIELGVTYRNIGIRLRIVSRFADIDRIVAEALGEIPISDEAPPPKTNAPQTTSPTPPRQKPPQPK